MNRIFFLLLSGFTALAQSQPDGINPGTINGTIVDVTATPITQALVTISRDDNSPRQAVQPDNNGKFSFTNLTPGPFHLAIAAPGFAPHLISGVLHPDETSSLPQIVMVIATLTTDVQVTFSRTQIAEDEIKAEEKQRLIGIFPNYYVSYVPNALPLTSKDKFALSWKFVADPVNLLLTAVIAGVQQEQNEFDGFGQGAQGYGKRYGASYANFVTGFVITSAVLPSILKQDPRYFYKGTGTKRSRILYALATSVICKGDNAHWQVNYSNILGSIAAGGLSNLYYPAQNRNGAALTFENAAIGIAATAGGNLIQEFFSRKLTPSLNQKKSANHS